MPGLVRTHSSVSGADDPNNEDRSTPSSTSATPGPSNANKRVRLSPERAASRDVDDSWVLSPPGTVRPSHRTQRQGTGSRASSIVPQQRNRRVSGNTISSRAIESARGSRLPAMPSFKPGQLVRVHLRNFVTYTSATFLPGPTLNMIIGPNGTGKSSVVCAICIGLDFGTAPLGRAKELSEFVKHGCSEATVEIELKGEQGQINPIITLDIEKEGSKKKWHINGRSCGSKDVKRITKQFGIQIDNLCHFLPQDRVVEFSRLSPKDRLASTLRGAAPDHLTEQHEQLKELATQQSLDLKKQADSKWLLKGLEEKQSAQRGDVERIRERRLVQENVKLLEHTRPLAMAMQAQFVFEEKRAEVRELQRDIQALKDSQEPGQTAIKKREDYAKEVEKAKKSRKRACDQFESMVTRTKAQLGGSDDTLKDANRDVTDKEREIKAKERKVIELRNSIERMETNAKEPPLDFDPAEMNERGRQMRREIQAKESEIAECNAASRQYDQTIKQRRADIQENGGKIAQLATEAGKQKTALGKISEQTVKAWDWIESHRDMFKGEVYAPPVLSCSVKNPARVVMIESMFQANDFTRITVMNQDDWQMLNQEFHDKQSLADIVLSHYTGQPLQNFKPPISQDAAESFGVEGWAIDYIEGPEPVLAQLCQGLRMHQAAILANDMTDEQFNKFQSDLGLQICITPQRRYTVKSRAEYGPAAKSTLTQIFNQVPQAWGSAPVDNDAGSELEQEIAAYKEEIRELTEKAQASKNHVKDLNDRKAAIEAEKDALSEEKSQKQIHNSMLANLPNKIEAAKKDQQQVRDEITETRLKLEDLKQACQKILLDRAQHAIDYTSAVENLRSAHMHLITASIAHIEATSDIGSLKEQFKEWRQQQELKENAMEKAQEARRAAKDAHAKNLRTFTKILDKVPAVSEWYNNSTTDEQSRSPDDLEAEIESQTARMQMLAGGDPNAIKQYEERAEKIERGAADLAGIEERVQGLEVEINGIRRTWEPELDALVARISEAFAASFERIGCLGSVEVGKSTDGYSDVPDAVDDDESNENNINNNDNNNNAASPTPTTTATTTTTTPANQTPAPPAPKIRPHDFANWTIQIRVSFRAHESLSVLDHHRQSGGERAVTTIYYLMALQSLSRAPFRVVDEINQGMDPRNERVVHERMVEIACGGGSSGSSTGFGSGSGSGAAHHGENEQDDDNNNNNNEEKGGSQYFLITPKLLPGLKYDPRMKVHTIASGEFMPRAEGERGGLSMDFGRCVERLRAVKGAA